MNKTGCGLVLSPTRHGAGMLALAALLALPAAATGADGGFSFLGYAQLTAEHFNGDDGIAFGADRIRVRGAYEAERFATGMMQPDARALQPLRLPGSQPSEAKVFGIRASFTF